MSTRLGGRSWAGWAVLFVAFVALLAYGATKDSGPHTPEERVESISRRLACPVCDGESVADSNAPESRAIRADIAKRIRAGQRDSQIRAAYVERYDEKILLTPSNDGIGIVAWGIPIVALVLGGAGIVFAVRRWSTSPRLAATDDDENVVDRERHREDDA